MTHVCVFSSAWGRTLSLSTWIVLKHSPKGFCHQHSQDTVLDGLGLSQFALQSFSDTASVFQWWLVASQVLWKGGRAVRNTALNTDLKSQAFWQDLTGSQQIWKMISFKIYHRFTCFKCYLSLCLPVFLYGTLDMFTVRRNNPHMQHLDNPFNMENLFQSLKFSIQADTYSKKRDMSCLDYW